MGLVYPQVEQVGIFTVLVRLPPPLTFDLEYIVWLRTFVLHCSPSLLLYIGLGKEFHHPDGIPIFFLDGGVENKVGNCMHLDSSVLIL